MLEPTSPQVRYVVFHSPGPNGQPGVQSGLLPYEICPWDTAMEHQGKEAGA